MVEFYRDRNGAWFGPFGSTIILQKFTLPEVFCFQYLFHNFELLLLSPLCGPAPFVYRHSGSPYRSF